MSKYFAANVARARRAQSQRMQAQHQRGYVKSHKQQAALDSIDSTIRALGDGANTDNINLCSDRSLWGAIAVGLYVRGAPDDILRAAVKKAWIYNHTGFIRAAKSKHLTAIGILRACRFEHDLPETMTVWRGARDVRLDVAIRGFSWTRDREAACWYACRRFVDSAKSYYLDAHRPIVVTREITRASVVLHLPVTPTNPLDEVVLDAQPAGVVDAASFDWHESASNYSNRHEDAAIAFGLLAPSVEACEALVPKLAGGC